MFARENPQTSDYRDYRPRYGVSDFGRTGQFGSDFLPGLLPSSVVVVCVSCVRFSYIRDVSKFPRLSRQGVLSILL